MLNKKDGNLKRRLKCENENLVINFHKDNKRKDDLHSHCRSCGKQIQREYPMKSRKKRNKFVKNRIKTDDKFRLIVYTRKRIYKSLKSMTKRLSTRKILGIDIDAYKNWLEFQTTLEMNWGNIDIDHVKPICMFDVSEDEELREAFTWKNTQPLLKQDLQQKGTKFNFLIYQLQFIRAYQFSKLNEE